MDVDTFGNTVTVGPFIASVDFGGGTIVGNASYDIFVVKFDVSGNHIWSRGFSGPGSDRPIGVTFDADGNVYVTGAFADSLTFGGSMLVSAGDTDVFLLKLDSNGNLG